MAVERIISPHPLRLLRSHLRRCVPGGEPNLKDLRANSTNAEKSASRKDLANRTIIQAKTSRRPGEASQMTQLSQSHQSSQQRRPYLFQFCTSLAIWFSADMIAQQIGDTEYDAAQTGRMLIIGGSASIPMYKWFTFISTRFKAGPGLPKFINTIFIATMRTLLTCCILTPVISVYFFTMQSLLSGRNLANTWEHLQQALPQSWKSAFKYWPVVNVINFSVVPTQYRGIFQAFAGLFWQTYLAWMNKRMMNLEKAENGQCQDTEEPIVMKSHGSIPTEC